MLSQYFLNNWKNMCTYGQVQERKHSEIICLIGIFELICLLYLNHSYNTMFARNKKENLSSHASHQYDAYRPPKVLFTSETGKLKGTCLKVLYNLYKYILGLFNRFRNEMNYYNPSYFLSFSNWKLHLSSHSSLSFLPLK